VTLTDRNSTCLFAVDANTASPAETESAAHHLAVLLYTRQLNKAEMIGLTLPPENVVLG